MLFQSLQTTRIAITRTGGTGKSQLTLKLVYAIKAKDNSYIVFQIDISNLDSLRRGYIRIAQKLYIPGQNLEDVDVKNLVR